MLVLRDLTGERVLMSKFVMKEGRGWRDVEGVVKNEVRGRRIDGRKNEGEKEMIDREREGEGKGWEGMTTQRRRRKGIQTEERS